MKLVRALIASLFIGAGASAQAAETAGSGDSSLIFSVFDSVLNVGVYVDTGLNFSDIVTDLTFVPDTVNPDQTATFASFNQSFDIDALLSAASLDSIATVFGSSNPDDVEWNLVAGDATQLAAPAGTSFGPPTSPQVGLSLLTTMETSFGGNSLGLENSIQNLDDLINANNPDDITVVNGANPQNPAFTGNYSDNFGQPGLTDNAGAFGDTLDLVLLTSDAVFLGNNGGIDFFTGNNGIDPLMFDSGFTATFDGSTLSLAAGTAVIPVPAAVWLFGSAIAGLIGFSRRRQLATA